MLDRGAIVGGGENSPAGPGPVYKHYIVPI